MGMKQSFFLAVKSMATSKMRSLLTIDSSEEVIELRARVFALIIQCNHIIFAFSHQKNKHFST